MILQRVRFWVLELSVGVQRVHWHIYGHQYNYWINKKIKIKSITIGVFLLLVDYLTFKIEISAENKIPIFVFVCVYKLNKFILKSKMLKNISLSIILQPTDIISMTV